MFSQTPWHQAADLYYLVLFLNHHLSWQIYISSYLNNYLKHKQVKITAEKNLVGFRYVFVWFKTSKQTFSMPSIEFQRLTYHQFREHVFIGVFKMVSQSKFEKQNKFIKVELWLADIYMWTMTVINTTLHQLGIMWTMTVIWNNTNLHQLGSSGQSIRLIIV